MTRPSFMILMLILIPAAALGQTFQGQWSDEFFHTATNACPTVMLEHDDVLIVGGSFRTAGRVDAHNVAWFDGSTWRAFTGGIPHPVIGMVVHEGQVLALSQRWGSQGGYYKQLWQLENNRWLALGEEQLLGSNALASFGGNLFLGSHVWSGNAFVDFFHANNLVETLAVQEDGLIIGGQFTACGTDTLGCLVLWDGVQLRRPWPEVAQRVRRVITHGDAVVAMITTMYPSIGIWQWQGGDWQPMPLTGIYGYVNPGFIMSYRNELYAAITISQELMLTRYRFLRWTGSAWGDVFGYDNEIVTATKWRDGLAMSTPGFALGETWFGTVFRMPPDHQSEPLQAIGPIGRGFSGGNVRALHVGAELVVGGSFKAIGDLYSPGVVFRVIDWMPLPAIIDGALGSVNAVHSTNGTIFVSLCLPAGCVDDCGTFYYGGGWQRVSQVPEIGAFASLSSWVVYGSTASTVYRVTSPTITAGTATGNIQGLSRWGQAVIAYGNLTAMNGVPVSRIARYQSGQWHAFSAPIGGLVRAAIDWNGQLVVAGRQLDPDGPDVWQVGVWTGTGWQLMDGSFNNTVLCLAVHEGHLFAGGLFTAIDGVPANRVAAWDGEAWRPVGVGCDGAVSSMASREGKLWLAGAFTHAGGKVATGLAHWTFMAITGVDTPDRTRAPMALHAPHPNPSNPQTTVAFDLPRAGLVRLEIHDLRGRLLARLVDGYLAEGRHMATWKGLDVDGRPAPSGVYLVRLRADDQVATRRLSLIR